jgi:hypothetical protein
MFFSFCFSGALSSKGNKPLNYNYIKLMTRWRQDFKTGVNLDDISPSELCFSSYPDAFLQTIDPQGNPQTITLKNTPRQSPRLVKEILYFVIVLQACLTGSDAFLKPFKLLLKQNIIRIKNTWHQA